MMKTTWIAALLFFSSTSIFAQNFAAPDYGFRLGLTAHPTFGWLKAENGKGNGVSLGFSYGLMADFNFAENYSFATGLTVTTINGKSTEISPNLYHAGTNNAAATAYDLKYKLQYLELPFTVKLKTDKISDVRWYGQFGLSNDFNISAKQNAEVDGNAIVKDKNIKDFTKFYRAGLILGAGGEFDVDNHTSITAGLTYNNGFTNIVKDNGRNVKNHYIGINFGVFF
jgi:hypothetical protein